MKEKATDWPHIPDYYVGFLNAGSNKDDTNQRELNNLERILTHIDKSPEDIAKQDIDDWIQHCINDKDNGRKYVRQLLYNLDSFLGHLTEERLIDENPVDRIDREHYFKSTQSKKDEIAAEERRDPIYYFEPDEIQSLVKATPHPRDKLIIEIMAYCGTRAGETVYIRLEDIYTTEAGNTAIKIISSKKGGYDDRPVYPPPALARRIQRYIDDPGKRDSILKAPESEYLFPSRSSLHVNKSRPNKVLKDACEATGIQVTDYETNYEDWDDTKDDEDKDKRSYDQYTSHSLRHTFAVNSIKNGMDIKTLSRLLGHASADITANKYLRFKTTEIESRATKFGFGW
jgi:integrase/recombinase XerD